MDVKSIIKLIPGFKPTPKSGTVSTIQKSASAFVKRRKQTGAKSVMPIKKAMGGQASEGVARGKILKDMKARNRKRLMESLERLEAKSKKKSRRPSLTPKRPKGLPKQMERPRLEKPFKIPPMIRPKLEKPFKKPKAERAK